MREDDVQIAANVQLLSNNHDPYDRQILICKPIVIKKGAWIGAGATIMPGVTIGRHAIVGAVSLVTRDVDDNVMINRLVIGFYNFNPKSGIPNEMSEYRTYYLRYRFNSS